MLKLLQLLMRSVLCVHTVYKFASCSNCSCADTRAEKADQGGYNNLINNGHFVFSKIVLNCITSNFKFTMIRIDVVERSISELHFENPFQGYFNGPPFTSPGTENLAPGSSGARCRHLAHHLNLASGVSQKRAIKTLFKMLISSAVFLVQSSQKLWSKPD